MHFCSMLIVSIVSCLLPPQVPKPAEDKDKIQGVWVFSSSERDGKQELTDLKGVLEIELGADTFRFHLPAGARHAQSYKLDPKASPKTIDWTPAGKPEPQQPMLGIYELDGDSLKICWGPIRGARPKEFTAKAGTQHWLWILKRQQKK